MLVGPEARGSRFEEAKIATEAGAGRDDAANHIGASNGKVKDEEYYSAGEKEVDERYERS